jgi:hypothetical protein
MHAQAPRSDTNIRARIRSHVVAGAGRTPSRLRRRSAMLGLAVAGTLALPSGALALDTAPTVAAINSVGGLNGVVAGGATDADSASITTIAGTTVDIPKSSADPVNVTTSDGNTVKFGIPAAAGSSDATPTSSGSVVFGAPRTTSAAQALSDGSARLLITIPSADAPHDYAVPITLPPSSQAALLADGGLAFADASGKVFAGLNAPIALDANGQRLPTYFNIAGGTVTQHIDFSASTAFPIVADHLLSKLVGLVTGTITAVGHVVGGVVNALVSVVKSAASGCIKWGFGAVVAVAAGGWPALGTLAAAAVTGCAIGAVISQGPSPRNPGKHGNNP